MTRSDFFLNIEKWKRCKCQRYFLSLRKQDVVPSDRRFDLVPCDCLKLIDTCLKCICNDVILCMSFVDSNIELDYRMVNMYVKGICIYKHGICSYFVRLNY